MSKLSIQACIILMGVFMFFGILGALILSAHMQLTAQLAFIAAHPS